MPRPLHLPSIQRFYSGGASIDVFAEVLGTMDPSKHINARNARSRDSAGKKGVLKKINGEELLYPNLNNYCWNPNPPGALSSTHICILFTNFFLQADNQQHLFEVYVDYSTPNINPPLIRIDGKIVLRTAGLAFSADYPLQYDLNESCIGGEIYITDFHIPPVVLSLKDMMVNGGLLADDNGTYQCTQKYFADFDIKEYQIGLELPLDHPVFVGVRGVSTPPPGATVIGNSSGLPVGQYQYSIRASTSQGDRTNWSVATPLISVPLAISNNSDTYPYVKTLGADPSVLSAFGIHFRFRINNELNYDFIEIKRVKFNSGQGIGTLGVEEKMISVINITPGQFSIQDVFDTEDTGTALTLADQSTEPFANIEAAKAIRYYGRRLVLMNIKYASRDIEGKIEFLEFDTGTVNAKRMVPVIKNMGKAGHNDPYTNTYFKSLMRGEIYGNYAIFHDQYGIGTFATVIPENTPQTENYASYKMPNRRQVADAQTQTQSTALVRAATVGGTVDDTHEVFDLDNSITKVRCAVGTWQSTFKNIINQTLNTAGRGAGKVNGVTGCPDGTVTNNLAFPFGGVLTQSVGYEPFFPTRQISNLNVSSHNYRVNIEVRPSSGGPGNNVSYNPKGFALNYHTMGMSFAGVNVNSLPKWMQSFSLTRTRPAKRIVAQGLAFYALRSATNTGNNTGKSQTSVWFYSPDLDPNILTPAPGSYESMQTIINSLGSGKYKLQMVSPLGFFSEIYDFENRLSIRSWRIDAISYCRILRDSRPNPQINPTEDLNMGLNGNDGFNYVAYGKWRNPAAISSGRFINSGNNNTGNDGEQLFDITTINPATYNGRGTYWEIGVSPFIFNHGNTGGDQNFDEIGLKQWHEPVYICNIVQDDVTIPNQNINDTYETGHYQKLNAKVGVSNGSNAQTFLLVDERPEDCLDLTGTQDGVVFLENGNVKTYWQDVTNKSSGQITTILNNIQAGTQTATFNGNVYFISGVFKHTVTNLGPLQNEYRLLFSTANNPGGYPNTLFIPQASTSIRVKYNMDRPIHVYGGDTVIGESVFAPLDLQYENGNNPLGGTNGPNDFRINVGFPFRVYEINPRVYICNNTSSNINMVQDDHTCKFTDGTFSTNDGKMRQLVCMFTCESRVHMPLAHANENVGAYTDRNFFPNVHYVMRPHKWDTGTPSNKIQSQYFNDYPNEHASWNYGGFKFLPASNVDYTNEPLNQVHVTKPQQGFNDETEFCSRVIWSSKRDINVVNAPGVKTFPVNNIYDLSDDSGEIKFAWDDRTEKAGSNLFAFTDRGIARLMTDKRYLHELSGGALATMGVSDDLFVQQEDWITKDIGMHDEMWRSASEYRGMLFFANHDSVYMFNGSDIPDDIARNSLYHRDIHEEYLSVFKAGYRDHITSVVDTRFKEYWLHIERKPRVFLFGSHFFFTDLATINPQVSVNEIIELSSTGTPAYVYLPTGLAVGFVFYVHVSAGSTTLTFLNSVLPPTTVTNANGFSNWKFTHVGGNIWEAEFISAAELPQTWKTFAYYYPEKFWNGYYDYRFERFTSYKNRTFGAKALTAYELHKGWIINNSAVRFEADQVFTPLPEDSRDKEFVFWWVNSNSFPWFVDFYDDVDQLRADTPIASVDVTTLNSMHDRGTYGHYVPRETLSPFNRVQGMSLVMRIRHFGASEFNVKDSGVHYKPIR